MRFFYATSDLFARARLVAARSGRGHMTGAFTRETLPEPIRAALDARSPGLMPYEDLAAAWHTHGSTFLPRYGDYLRLLIESGEIQGDAALDLACGTGITTAALAALYRRVFALDASPHMLAQARTRLERFPHVECLEADFRSFTVRERVGLVVCSGDSLNYALSLSELTDVFACVSKVLRPGGLFLFDVQNEASFRMGSGLIVRHGTPELEWYQAHQYDPATRIDDACTITVRGVERHRRRFISPDDVNTAAARVGLALTKHFANPLLRVLARGSGRDFYAVMAA